MDAGILIAIIGGGSAILGAIITNWFNRRKNSAETRRTDAETDKTIADAQLTQSKAWQEYAEMLRDEMIKMKDDMKTMKEDQDTLKSAVEELEKENGRINRLLNDYIDGTKQLVCQIEEMGQEPAWLPTEIKIRSEDRPKDRKK